MDKKESGEDPHAFFGRGKNWPDEMFFSKPPEIEKQKTSPVALKHFVFCDEEYIPRFAYPQGSKVFLFGELLIKEIIRIPYIQVDLFDKDKKLVHGKNSIQHRVSHFQENKPGEIIRFCQWIELGLAAGAYTVSFSVFDISAEDYENLAQIQVELGRIRKRLLIIDPIAALAVYLADRPGPKRQHEGICDLKGGCWFEQTR